MFNSRWTLQRTVNPMSKLPQKFIIMDFFLLVELETKPIIFTTTQWSTITLKMKKSSKKKFLKYFKI